MMLVWLFLLGAIVWLIYKLYIWPYYISPLRIIPGPPSENPFYGSIKRIFSTEPSKTQLEWITKYGNVMKIYWILNEPVLVVADTKIVQEITLNNSYDYVKPTNTAAISVIGRGLVFSEGDSHKRQRKMMNPAFSHNSIKEMIPTFVSVALTLKNLIEDKVNIESEINLTPYLSKTTLDIIGLVGFNYEINSLTDSQNELVDAYKDILDHSTSRIIISLSSNYIPSIRKIPISVNKTFDNACKVIERVSNKLIKEKSNQAKNDKLNENNLISLFININNTLPDEEKISEEEIKYQVMTFLLAGHETTNSTICWILLFLAQHPQEQDSLREELVKAFPDKSKFNPTYDEINSLEYLNCIIKETLRLRPPLPIISRTSTKDKILGEYFIPKNTRILIAVAALHRLPSIWGPTANDFDPKRWLNPDLIRNVSNLNYLPFYNGTRSCIGSKIALSEIKIILSMLIRNFVFRPVEGFHFKTRVFPMPKPDPYLALMVSKVEV